MSERTRKVASQIQKVAAQVLASGLETLSGYVTVTGVDVSPDIKHATVWVDTLPAFRNSAEEVFERVLQFQGQIQRELAKASQSKFTSKVHLQRDIGQEHAEKISKILQDI